MRALMVPLTLLVVSAGLPPAAWRTPPSDASAAQANSPGAADIVFRASDVSQSRLRGRWTLAADPTSPGGVKLATADDEATGDVAAGAGGDEVEFTFTAPAGVPYRVWLRLAAEGDSASGDSVWVQFSDAEVAGVPAYRIDSSDALLVELESCPGCGNSGWGWQGSSWRLQQSPIVTFAASRPHRLRIQVREGGVQIDQIVLSPERYMRAAPGPARDDRTALPGSVPGPEPGAAGGATEGQ